MRTYNFLDNDDAKVIAAKGPFKVVEWRRDLPVPYLGAQAAYFAAKMDVRRRQLVAELDGRTGVTLQAGAMQWTAAASARPRASRAWETSLARRFGAQ